MKYIVCKKFKDLRKGSTCEEINGFITHNDVRICAKTSQNAYDYFSRNDDKKGYERYALVGKILDRIKELVMDYNDARVAAVEGEEAPEDKVRQFYNALREQYPNMIRENSDILTFDFYNADVELLQEVLKLL